MTLAPLAEALSPGKSASRAEPGRRRQGEAPPAARVRDGVGEKKLKTG